MNTTFYPNNVEKKTILILEILGNAEGPMGSRLISRCLNDQGVALSERAVRYHLKLMDERGLTKFMGKHVGRTITELGIEEISSARVQDKIGFAISRIENLAFRTTFDPKKCQGLLPVNVSFFLKEQFKEALEAMVPAFNAGIFVSELVAVAEAGKRLGGIRVPEGRIGFATVCSIVINGVLLKSGVPLDSKFGGILQLKDGKPLRFVELIYYSGSSLDPSEAFIQGNMTSVREAAERGEGKIAANFRDFPVLCLNTVEKLTSELKRVGIGGVLTIGKVSESICQIPVDVNKVGMILVGGLNLVACAQEAGFGAENYAMSTVMDYGELINFQKLRHKELS